MNFSYTCSFQRKVVFFLMALFEKAPNFCSKLVLTIRYTFYRSDQPAYVGVDDHCPTCPSCSCQQGERLTSEESKSSESNPTAFHGPPYATSPIKASHASHTILDLCYGWNYAPLKRYGGILMPGTSECDIIWR